MDSNNFDLVKLSEQLLSARENPDANENLIKVAEAVKALQALTRSTSQEILHFARDNNCSELQKFLNAFTTFREDLTNLQFFLSGK